MNIFASQILASDKELQEEVDRLQVKEFANEIMNKEQDFHSTMLYTTSTKGTKKLKQRYVAWSFSL